MSVHKWDYADDAVFGNDRPVQKTRALRRFVDSVEKKAFIQGRLSGLPPISFPGEIEIAWKRYKKQLKELSHDRT